ncbi:MAG: NDP-sugar synthase [Phycisphaerales bacterium]|nr:NDP-sugar synthase [Phycisphaerales bacterium]
MSTVITDDLVNTSEQQGTADSTALILCGGLKPPPLAAALCAPLLTLPQTADRTLLRCWLDAFDLAGIGVDRCRLLTDTDSWGTMSPVPCVPDSGPYRGPAGVLRDALNTIDSTDCCVIVEGSRMLETESSLDNLLQAHRSKHDAITVATNPDGSFAGIFVADPAAIGLIPSIGFIDIKEQWLPAAAREGFEIHTHALTGFCFSARTPGAYLRALRQMGWFTLRGPSRVIGHEHPGIFGTLYGGSLISQTANVSPEAVASCSAIGEGVQIAAGAVVIRSIVGSHARIGKNEVIIDTVIPAADEETVAPSDQRG